MNEKRDIIWNETVVGQIEIVGIEMFSIYGYWHSNNSDASDSLIEFLMSGNDAAVKVNYPNETLDAVITSLKNDWIEIRIGIT